MSKLTSKQTERDESIKQLRQWIKPGDTLHTILRHVSRSGRQREISVVKLCQAHGETSIRCLDWHVSRVLGDRIGKHDGIVVGGCGMDMGFHLVYNLSYALYGEGYKCKGKGKCPSNYHSNHHREIRCPGKDDRFCYQPNASDPEAPRHQVTVDGITVPGRLMHVLTPADGEPEHYNPPYEVCPTCKGTGWIPNPEGPERFDLVHTDGYAINHRWL